MADPQKKNDILKAASHCFAHYGFTKTTMDDIGKMVGLNKASLYYYYKNKDAIFCEIIMEEREKFLCRLSEKIENISAWHEKIQAYLLERERYFQKTVNLHKLSIKTSEQLMFQPLFRDLRNRFILKETEVIREILDRAMKKKQIREVDTRNTARIILSVAQGLKQQILLSGKDNLIPTQFDFKEVEEDIRLAVSLLLKGLLPEK